MAALPCASATLHWRQFAFRPIDKMTISSYELRLYKKIKQCQWKLPGTGGCQSLQLNSTFNSPRWIQWLWQPTPGSPATSDLTSTLPPSAPLSAVAAPHQRCQFRTAPDILPAATPAFVNQTSKNLTPILLKVARWFQREQDVAITVWLFTSCNIFVF